jgi:hypothetical protein
MYDFIIIIKFLCEIIILQIVMSRWPLYKGDLRQIWLYLIRLLSSKQLLCSLTSGNNYHVVEFPGGIIIM